jgi:hypothetical protein
MIDEKMIMQAAIRCDAETIEDAFIQGVRWALDVKDKRGGYGFSVVYYQDSNTGNKCERFVVTDPDGNKVYERDYGSTGAGFTEYVDDYFRYINTIGYRSDTSGFSGYNTTETGY